MKILIAGGVAGGASAAARLRRLDENAEIIIFEKGEYISFANCGIPYYCGNVIKEREKLLLLTPEQMDEMFNIETRVEAEVVKIDRQNKTVYVLDKNSDVEYQESYDKLIISTGSAPIRPNIPGINDERIFTVRSVPDADNIKNYIAQNKVKKAVVVGGGYIGLEMAENLNHLGIDTTIVEGSTQVLAPVDYEIAAQIHNYLRDKQIRLNIFDGVKAFYSDSSYYKGISVELYSGKKINTDIVILAVGVKPESKFAKEAGIELGQSGGILVNEHMQTSDENIYAVGDVVEVKDLVTGQDSLIPLAGPANRQGRIAADNICGIPSKYKATQGTAIIKIFDMAVAATGSNEKQLSKNNIPFLKTYISGSSHAEYYPNSFPLFIKLLFSPQNGKILGSQIIGIEGVDKRIDIISSAVKFEKTVFDLAELELSYAPPFGSAKDPVNIAGMSASNIINGIVNPLYWHDVEKFGEEDFILDVRTKDEQFTGRLAHSYNIPFEELRSRLKELPSDKKIVVYCNKGKKSYFASRILLQSGFKNVCSLNGGYSLYKQVMEEKNSQKHPHSKTEGYADFDSMPFDEISETESENEIDACGMQCPGPIMALSKKLSELKKGETVKIKTTDTGFRKDVASWCSSTGNTLISISDISAEDKIITAIIQKGIKGIQTARQKVCYGHSSGSDKTIVVFSNDLDKALAAFIIANGAAATGNQVTMFFTFWGLNILRQKKRPKIKKSIIEKMLGRIMPKGADRLVLSKLNMFGLGTLMMKRVMKSKKVASLSELIEQAQDAGVKFIACQMSLDVMGIKPEELISGVEFGGVASYINAAEHSDINLFI